jgi:hypothetical protein
VERHLGFNWETLSNAAGRKIDAECGAAGLARRRASLQLGWRE